MFEQRTESTDSYGALTRRAAWVAIGGGVSVIAYWTLFFSGAIEGTTTGSLLHHFELAFPGADSLLAAAAIGAGVSLLRGGSAGVFLLIVAGAMSLYLGVVDVSFYGRQGLYLPLTGPGGFELVVNAMCILGGGYVLRAGWLLSTATPSVGEVRPRLYSDDARRKVG